MKELIKPEIENKIHEEKVEALCEEGFFCSFRFKCGAGMQADKELEEDILF